MSVNAITTLAVSFNPSDASSETVYCAVAPSSCEVGPVIDQLAESSAVPAASIVSWMVVLTVKAAVSTVTAAPVVDPALEMETV